MSQPVDANSRTARFVTRMGKMLRSDKHYSNEAAAKRTAREKGKLRKRPQAADIPDRQAGVNELGEREYSVFSDTSTLVEPAVHHQQRDHTDMMHQLSLGEETDDPEVLKRMTVLNPTFSIRELLRFEMNRRRLERLPPALWGHIATLLDPASVAFLSLTNRFFFNMFGPGVMWSLNQPENRHYKNQLLNHYDKLYPNHLLCMHCSQFHPRVQPGHESLRINYVLSPVVICPRVKSSVLPRMRLTHGRELPYAFVQLALREHNFSPYHGMPHTTLARQWKCKDSEWTHRTRYMVIDRRLALRVRSECFAAPDLTETAQRHLLYDREEYTPFFSVCAHWRDGELMDVCKCALSHVPRPPKSYAQQLKQGPSISRANTKANFIITGCDFCRPARRCPDCPSEYLAEILMVEDPNDAVQRFKHALVVTRWTDLGDGSSPFTSPEWVAITGQKPVQGAESYDSITRVGRRAIAGVFESAISGTVPGQRLISMNPRREKRGEEGHGWY